MLHFRERVPRSWLRRVAPAGKGDASAGSSGTRRNPGSSFAVRMASSSPCPGTGQTFPFPLCLPPVSLHSRIRCCLPRRPWSSWFGWCGIMQKNLNLPGEERKEGMVIHLLARLVYRQVCAPKEGIRDESDSPPLYCPNVEPTFSISCPNSSAQASSSGMETLVVGNWSEPPAQALVILFTQLAQRCVQAARAQEEIHEYRSYHHSSSRTDRICLCTAIDPGAA